MAGPSDASKQSSVNFRDCHYAAVTILTTSRVSGPCGKCKLCDMQVTKFCGRKGNKFEVWGNFMCESVGVVNGMHSEVCHYVGKTQNSLRKLFYAQHTR
jgi:hypothetical protein